MQKRGYTHVKELVPAIQQMVAEGKTQREIKTGGNFSENMPYASNPEYKSEGVISLMKS